MGVSHRHGDRGMAHQFLDGTDIDSRHHSPRREGMPQGVPGDSFDFCPLQGWFVDLHHEVSPLHRLCGGEGTREQERAVHPGSETLDDVQRGIRQNNVASLAGFTQWNGQDALFGIQAVPARMKLLGEA